MKKYINKENILKAYDKLYLVENPNRKDSLFPSRQILYKILKTSKRIHTQLAGLIRWKSLESLVFITTS